MKIILFSSNINTINDWEMRYLLKDTIVCSGIESFNLEFKEKESEKFTIIADYDSIASEINTLISSNTLPKRTVVLERAPEITTGKMLISHGIKAYGNSKMHSNHYVQMIQTVMDDNVWTYPELTMALVKNTSKKPLNNEVLNLIRNRLTSKEEEVVYLILDGFTNAAVAIAMNITIRTVKSYMSLIFSKLHVNDRIALVLLLK